jgi:hypothetical protein
VSDVNAIQGGAGTNKTFRRMLFVGLGGSGGKTLRFLKRDLETWLRSVGWTQGIPQGWQFLQIDTPTVADGTEIKSAPMLAEDEYLGLVNAGADITQLDDSLYPLSSGNRIAGSSWRVVPASLNVNIQTGAGQYRAVGRTVALAYLAATRERLKLVYGKLTQPGAQASLSQLFLQVHKHPPTGSAAAPLVVVVSSLAGGTGAGLINDVCDLLRDIDPNAGESFGILYTPDVFSELLGKGGNDAAGIQPNSLAAICEVLNGYWWHGGAGGTEITIPKKQNPLMTQAGAINSLPRTGPAYPFLVGSKNSHGVSYEKSEQLFEIVGAALTSWVTDLTVQSKLISYSQSNWKNGAVTLRVAPHALVNKGSATFNEAGINAFSALGFARVSLGTRYFENYAAERIARSAVEFVAKNFETGATADNLRAQQPNITSQELIEKQAEVHVDTFMRMCNLSPEPGGEYHFAGDPFLAIEKELRPENFDSTYHDCLEWAVSQATQDGKHSAQDWLSWIYPAVEDAATQFDQRSAPIIEENLKLLISSKQKQVVDEVLKLIGMVGIQITERVLEKTIQKLAEPTHGYLAQLKESKQSDSQYAGITYWQTQVANVYEGKNRRIPAGDSLRTACENGLVSAIFGTGVKVKQVTIDFLDQFISGFLRPLQHSLSIVTQSYATGIGAAESWPTWPLGNGIATLSQSSKPPMSEYTVIKPDNFPALFDELIAMTIPGEAGQNAMRLNAVRSDVVDGLFLDDIATTDQQRSAELAKLQSLRITNDWWPNLNQHLSTPRVVSTVVFKAAFDLDSIKDRAYEWLHRKETPTKTLLESSLRSYLDSQSAQNVSVSPQVMMERQGEFLQAFTSAVDASRPLVELDTQLMAVLYPGQTHPKTSVEVSTLPFEGHQLQSTLSQKICELNGLVPGSPQLDDYFKNSEGIRHIDITSRLSGPYPILAISSLLMPIAQTWHALSPDDRADFWDKRRARPLNEFIPAPQEHILSMLRGWFLGRKLGLVGKSRRLEGGSYFVAPRAPEPGYLKNELPRILLSNSSEWGDEPALVLESLGLAYVDVGLENSLEPLAGYINLLELGRSGTGASDGLLSDYASLADYVTNWIQSGTLELASGFNDFADMDLPESIIGVDAATRQRVLLEALKTELKKYQDEYSTYLLRIKTNSNELSSAPYWPSMFWLIETSLKQLIKKLSEPVN